MRVVIPVLSLHRGGGCRVLIEAANCLVDRGHEVTVVILEGEPIAWPLRCNIKRVPAITADTIPPADLILPNFWPTVLPAVTSGNGRVARFSMGFEPLWVPDREAALMTYRMGLPVITLGPHLRSVIRQATGQDCFMAQPGVDSSVFRPRERATNPRPRISYVYRSEAHGYFYKGNADLVAALELVRQKQDVEMWLVCTEGDSLHVKFPVPHEVKTAESDEEMASLYCVSDLYVLASWFEALSLPPLEAMACGTPVVLTDCGGVRDYAQAGVNCLMGMPKRPDMLADLILAALWEQPQRQHLQEGGFRTAAEWTWKRFGDQLEAALNAIALGAVEPPTEV